MRLFLAPMDGFTDCAYRIVVKEIFDKYNQTAELFFVTEFMSADWYIKNPAWVIKHIMKTDIENPLIAQIFWWNEEYLIQTAVSLSRIYDFYWIELNIWCPSPKIIQNWWWSWLLKDKNRTLSMIKNISHSIGSKFSIKTRSWLYEQDKQKQFDFIVNASEYCDMITVHGRTFAHGHVGEVDWDFIYQLKQKVNPKCKIIWNGGVKSILDAKDKIWNLDGIMIWQSAIGNPYVFVPEQPTIKMIRETVLYHLSLASSLELYFAKQPFEIVDGEFRLIMPKLSEINDIQNILTQKSIDWKLHTIKEFRKHLFSYVKWLLWSKPFKQNVISIVDYYDLVDEINRYFDEIDCRY